MGPADNEKPRLDEPHRVDARHGFDVVVIGGGHAGVEAAWASARLGRTVALVTLDPSKIGAMSCNPAIGGQAKGQMVREIDALGGLMGRAIDATGIQFRMLNRSKGPAVWGPRAQADKLQYASEIQRILKSEPRITIIAAEVAGLTPRTTSSAPPASPSDLADRFTLQLRSTIDAEIRSITARAVVLTTGTFMRGLMHTGEAKTIGGRVGEGAAYSISDALRNLGLNLGRLKTGTPPRLLRSSIDFSKFEPQPGDAAPAPFSFLHEYHLLETGQAFKPNLHQIECHLGQTSHEIHELIRANLHRAPMFTGQIEGTGPRYCPSIEDKVHRFADKPAHQLFLEPETLDPSNLGPGESIYVNGISTSLPADVQETFVRMIPGLEHAVFLKHGYAVEYDMVWPDQIDSTLQTKRIPGLFLAGQINGTSGYEEAGAQGLVAGVNAAQFAQNASCDFVLGRDQAYIGVLIDDLVTKPPTEPYRMFTSRAEHRLLLRADNADERLTPLAQKVGLIDEARSRGFAMRQTRLDALLTKLDTIRLEGQTLRDWLKRTDHDWDRLSKRCPELNDPTLNAPAMSDLGRLAEIRVKYAGYIERQDRQVLELRRLETKRIPDWMQYHTVTGLRAEAKSKLTQFTPRSLGQALRISGITPADVALIAVHIERGRGSR
jgi:tRNA uridine 5-carboxymethylaminomethyl modification enzyme